MPPPPPTSRRRAQTEATQDQLLTAAREVFTERGYQATTVAAVTERAATAHGTFYLYFRNKEDAFGQVISGVIEELFRQSEATWEADPVAGARQAIGGFLVVFAEHRGLWRALLEAMLSRPDIEALWRRLRRRFVDRIARNIVAGQAAGQVRAIEPLLAANALGSMVEWFAFTHLVLEPPPTGGGELDDWVDVLTDLWVHALFTADDGRPASAGRSH